MTDKEIVQALRCCAEGECKKTAPCMRISSAAKRIY